MDAIIVQEKLVIAFREVRLGTWHSVTPGIIIACLKRICGTKVAGGPKQSAWQTEVYILMASDFTVCGL